ncbi:MAG: OsmC family protein [archaeon]
MGVIRSTAEWMGNSQVLLSDGRGHQTICDLPSAEDQGPTALELSVMSYAGCIVTIFKIVAEKRRVSFDSLEVEVLADKPEGSKTIESVEFLVKIKSDASRKALEKILDITSITCPVGVIWKDAGIEPVYELEIL